MAPILLMIALFVGAYLVFRAVDLSLGTSVLVLIVLAAGHVGWLAYSGRSVSTVVGQAAFFALLILVYVANHYWRSRS